MVIKNEFEIKLFTSIWALRKYCIGKIIKFQMDGHKKKGSNAIFGR